MRRLPQFMLIVTTLANGWLLMQAVHEFGHVIGGLLTGAVIKQVVLHPLTISRTDFGRNPWPLIACWAGPVLGAILPVPVWLIARWRRQTYAFCLKFFAGFCLIANGAYLAVGAADGIGDAGDLLKLGSASWQLYLFGATAIPAGLWLWNGLGPSFGLNQQAESVTWRGALGSLLLLLVLVGAELLLTWLCFDGSIAAVSIEQLNHGLLYGFEIADYDELTKRVVHCCDTILVIL